MKYKEVFKTLPCKHLHFRRINYVKNKHCPENKHILCCLWVYTLMGKVLNHKGPIKCFAKPGVDFTRVFFESYPTLKIQGLWASERRIASDYIQMRLVVVALSPLLDVATPQKPPWPRAGWGREINVFPHLRNGVEREESYFKNSFKFVLILWVDISGFLNSQVVIHPPRFCSPLSASGNDSLSTSHAVEREPAMHPTTPMLC